MCQWDVCKQVLCLLISSIFVVGAVSTGIKHSIGKRSLSCILPPYPKDGRYEVAGDPSAGPGDVLEFVYLNVTCDLGTNVFGNNVLLCVQGEWSTTMPQCVDICQLPKDPSIEFSCKRLGSNNFGACEEFEPTGTRVKSKCRPEYYSSFVLPVMLCIGGAWDYVARCSPECGRVTPDGVDLIIDGSPAKRGELPWHVGIYRKTTTPYKQICGGSLVTTKRVITAAHCFWSDVSKLLPAANYAVAAGKLYRPWNNAMDVGAQKSDVSDIKIPARFQGILANFQDDIAVLILQTPIVYATYVRPVCLDFDLNFDRRQLQPGKLGKVASWGLTAENGSAAQILKVVELPYVDIESCISASPLSFIEYITSDKICAGFRNSTALCRGDSGGGLAFPESERGTDRYYLRGIVSTAATNDDDLCNNHTTFTHLLTHEHFIKEYL